MSQAIKKANVNVTKQKSKYLFLISITFIGIISGIFFIFFISKTDKSLVKDELDLFLTTVKEQKINYLSSLINGISNNLFYLIFIWILGISIIGIPIIVFLIFFKGFIFGFSISSIIVNYGFKGILIIGISQAPQNLILLATYILMGFYAVNFSIHLFQILFLKKDLNLRLYFKKYNQIALISLISAILCSIFETFIIPFLMKFFL